MPMRFALTERQQTIDSAYAGHQGNGDVLAFERPRRRGMEVIGARRLNGGSAVDGSTEAVEHPPQQLRTDVHA